MIKLLLSLFRSDWDFHYTGREFVMRRWKNGAYEDRALTSAEELSLREWQSIK